MASKTPQITIELPSIQYARFLQRRKLLGGVVAGGIGIICLFVFALQLVPKTLAARERMSTSEKTVSATTQRAAIITNISQEDQENFLRVAQALPQTKEPLIVLQALDDISREANVVVGEFDTTPGLVSTASAVANRAAARTTSQTLTIAVEISGTFQQINRALELLESAAPVMEVTELSLTPTDRNQVSAVLARYTATLQVTSYFLPAQLQASGQTAQPLTSAQKQTLEALLRWRNRLPTTPSSPEVFARTNLFVIEGLGGGLILPGQTLPIESTEELPAEIPAAEALPDPATTPTPSPASTPDPTLQQVPTTPEDLVDDGT